MNTALAAPTDARLRITHALLDHCAEAARVRVLHIKGVALDIALGEGRGGSSDCDILVDPACVRAFERELTANGWELRTHFETGSVFEHAATYYHPVWGTVDLHRTWPGLDHNPELTFDAWWQDREAALLGGRAVPVPSLLDQQLLLLLHVAREPGGQNSRDFRVTWGEAPEQRRIALEARARELGGLVPFMLITDTDGERRRSVMGMRGFHVWDALSSGGDSTAIWRARLHDARGLREHARLMWMLTKVNRDHLAVRLGHEPTRDELRGERVDRIRRAGRRLLPSALRPRVVDRWLEQEPPHS